MDGEMSAMAMDGAKDVPRFPPVAGYAAGERIFFAHTEASDPEIAAILSEMMGSPVLVVPNLAEVPDRLLAHVYVFENGLRPDGPRGPLGYQPDVFDNPAGSKGYTPLRQIMLVSWRNESDARIVKAAETVRMLRENGSVTIRETDIVVNMPFQTWPGGKR